MMEFLTPKDVAKRLKISERTAYRWMKTVPHINVSTGKKYEILRITEEGLEQLIGFTNRNQSTLTQQVAYAIKDDKRAQPKKTKRR